MDLQPQPNAVREEVERVSASEQFIRSRRLVRFLRFTVEKALEGSGDLLTESTLGTQVYDRDSNFDPLADGIVRTEVHRLRSKLREYYRKAGRSDPIQIEYPVGSYVPEFHYAAPEFLSKAGEVSSFLRLQDWSATPLGSVTTWPSGLKDALSLHLRSPVPAMVLWGPQLLVLFNDALYDLLGEPCRQILGQPFPENLNRDWPQATPAARRVLETGESSVLPEDRWLMYRKTHWDEHYFNTSLSPIMETGEKVAGVLILAHQTTLAVIRARRGKVLQALGERMLDSTSVVEACHASMAALQLNPFDIPFAALYLFDPGRKSAQLSGVTGMQPGLTISPQVVRFPSEELAFLAEAAGSGSPQFLQVGDRLGFLPSGPWSVAPRQLVVLPIIARGKGESAGFLLAAVNPHKELDEAYRGFFEWAAAQIAAMLEHAGLRERESKLAEQGAALERNRSSFLTYVTEEFRTPLTLLLGFLGKVIESSRLDDINRSHLAIARRNAFRLFRLLTALIDLGRIETGQMRGTFEPLNLGVLTTHVATQFRPEIERAGLRFVVDCPQLDEPAYIDSLMWDKTISYLLFNAVQRTAHGEIGIALRSLGAWIELVVWDTGSDLPPLQPRSSQDEPSDSGAELGLRLVQHFATLHGGNIQGALEQGKGNKFTVSIPKGKSHLPAQNVVSARTFTASARRMPSYVEAAFSGTEPQDPEADRFKHWVPDTRRADWGRREIGPRAGRRVVVAITDPDLRYYCQEVLGEVHTVEPVTSSEEALAAVAREPPDLLLADTVLQGANILGLLRAIREDQRTSSIPVVLLSAQNADLDRLRAYAAGADDYVEKPFTAQELLIRAESQMAIADLRKRNDALQKQAREESEAQRLVLETVIDQLPMAVLVAEVSSGKFILKNKAAYDMLGDVAHALRTLDDVRSDIGFRPNGTPYDREDCPIMRATRLGEVVADEEIIYRLPGGHTLWVFSNSYPIRNSQGRHVATVVTLTEKIGVPRVVRTG